jgi:general secretion pathway protein B
MSLILEALKKSEAERRRGQSPDLFGNALGTPAPRREIPRVWPLLVLGLILLASAWMIWSGGSRGEPVPPTVAPVSDEPAPAQTDVRTAPPKALVVQAPAPSQHAVATGGAKPAPSSAKPELPQPPEHVFATPTGNIDPAPVDPPEEALPTLSALDAASRAALPPLKLSMHVYADDPGKRFAIIDGQRIGEGALLAGGVVESIRRDGVVININGRRLLLPKP